MDRISLYKKLSLVGILAVSCLGSVSVNAELFPPKSKDEVQIERDRLELEKDKNRRDREDRERDRLESKEKQCEEAMDKVRKAHSKFMSACDDSSTTAKDCSETLRDCKTNSFIEGYLDPVNVVGQMIGAPPSATGGNKCSDYSYTDYKSEMKDLKSERKEAEKEIRDLQKEKIEKEKEIAKARADLQKDLAQAQKERAKEELKAKEEELNMEKARKDKEKEMRSKLRDLQTAILQASNAKAIMVASRAGDVEKYKAALMVCDATAEKQLKELQGNTSASLANRSAVAGSLNSAGAAKGNKKNAKATLMKGCVAEVTAKRNAEAIAYQNQMKAKDDEITKAQAEMQEVQQEMATLAAQYSQAIQNRKNAKAQEDAALQQEMAAKSAEMQALNTEYAQTQDRILTAIKQASTAVTQASNEIGSLEKEKPTNRGSKSRKEIMTEAQTEYHGVSCVAVCSGPEISRDLKDSCAKYSEKPVVTRSNPSSAGGGGSVGTQ